jgi:endonuclease III
MREIFARFQAANPEPKGELEHVNAFTLLVAVALSAQATDVGVNRATRALFAVADTPRRCSRWARSGLIEHIKTIGLFRNKAKNVMKLSRILVEDYGGEVPSSRAALQSLPGVGRKTANVVLNMWFRHAGAGGRHPHLPRRQPHRHRARPRRRRSSAPSRTTCRPNSSATRITG